MDIKVTTTKVEIDNESLNKGEYNIRECNFDLAEEFTGLVCKALFTVSKTKLTYEQSIVNGKCDIPYEATVNRGKVIVGVIGYEVEDEELVKRYSPEPDEFFVLDGSYIEDIENQSTPTPSELEQLEQRVSAIEIDAAQVEINKQDISDLQENKADKSELDDFITKDVNNLTYYTLTTQTGSQIELSLNNTNFKMTATLKDKNGAVVNTSNEIDLPLESVVINASYDNTTKELVLTLQNGTTVRVSIADLVSGLQTEITSSNKLASDLVDDSTSTNKFVTASEKTQITTNKNNITSLNTNKEDKSNKVTSLNSSSTNTQYPSAKAVYDNLVTKADKSSLVTGSGENITLSKTAELEFIQPPLPRGNSEQVQLSGKNLFPMTNQDFTLNNVRYHVENGSLYLDGTSTGETSSLNNSFKTNFGFTLPAGNYVLSHKTSLFGVYLYKEDGTKIKELAAGTASSAFSLSEETNVFIGFYVYNKSFDNYNAEIQIEQGSTATSYEPYVGGTASPNPYYPQPITNVTGDVEVLVQNKNLVDISDDNSIIGSSAYNKFTINNQVIATTGGTLVGFRAKVKPNSVFTMQAFSTFSSGTTNQIRLREYSKYPSNWDDNYILQTNKGLTNNGIATQTVTTSATTEWVLVVIYASGSGCTISNIQLEQNTTATTYTPHTERTYTFPLGTQRMFLGDYLADDGIHHVRKQVVFDGSENITANSMTDNVYRYVVPTSNRKSNGVALSNYFKQISVFNAGVGLFNGVGLNLCIENITTVADFKTWLSTHNVTVEYELATEEITPYTTEQQQAYDEIKQAISYEEQTNISGSSDESNPLFEVQAVKYKEPDYWTIAYVKTMIDKALQELS